MGFRSTDKLRQLTEHFQRQYASNLADDKLTLASWPLSASI
jgi:hypothetical protein